MKLLMVIPTLDQSGAEKQFCLLAEGLIQRGIDVDVIALTRGGPLAERLEQAGISVTILNKRFRFDAGVLLRLRKLIQAKQPDIVLSYLFAANTAVRLAVSSLKGKRPKVLISERCVDSWKSGWQRYLDRRLQSRTDALIANSNSVGKYYEAQGFPSEKIQVVPNGVTVPAEPDIDREEFCQMANVPYDAQLIGFVGRLAPQKRLKDLLWAIQMLRLSHPKAYLLIIGEGPQRDELEEYARKTEADAHTRFLGHRSDAGSLLHLIDVFWLASEFEGMSNSLMEAMACGKPAVVSDIPANRELIEHGKDGYIANLGDATGFTQYSGRLLDDQELAQRLGKAAQEKILTNFSVEKLIDRTCEIIHSL